LTRLDELPYPIVVDTDVAKAVGAFARDRGRAIVLADRNVEARARAIARAIGPKTLVLPFALGETRKRLRTVETVCTALAEAKADRTTTLVGVGGGVAGDLFGFVAASYMRGVPFINVATSLVAMVDASVGGKTGVDLAIGKNLVGAFRDPLAVFCDVRSLATLGDRHLREGLAEVVKHGVIEGDATFESLETLAPFPFAKWPWETVVADSLRVKAMVVADDRLERGVRETLNLGHTFGHALETVTNYKISHGAGVSVGLRAAGLLALRTGRFSAEEHLLLRLPLVAQSDDVSALLEAMSVDKKSRGGTPRFVVPRAIGDVEYGVSASARLVRSVLAKIAQTPGASELR
jgi:3-dehydroquinate synthase